METAEPLVVQDARLDARVAGNPAIADLGVVAYLGVPLTDARGDVLGSRARSTANPDVDSG